MNPISVDLPHTLGAAEARRRLEQGTGSLTRFLPTGARVQPAWSGNRLNLAVSAMGQELTAAIDVEETVVRVSVVLPPALSFFGDAIRAGIRRSGAELLEDKSKPPR